MNLKKFGFLALPALLLAMSSCLGDDDTTDYKEWKAENDQFITDTEADPDYVKVSADWDPTSFVLLNHIVRGDSKNKVTPLDNSTVDVIYLLTNVRGDTLDSSYALTTNGDSIFRTKPNATCTGFWMALTNMNIGDSVSAVMPYYAGYGSSGYGSILPYSTLVFQIKLVDIPYLETEP